eukprot:746828-Hanusia_phi.AAC.6
MRGYDQDYMHDWGERSKRDLCGKDEGEENRRGKGMNKEMGEGEGRMEAGGGRMEGRGGSGRREREKEVRRGEGDR